MPTRSHSGTNLLVSRSSEPGQNMPALLFVNSVHLPVLKDSVHHIRKQKESFTSRGLIFKKGYHYLLTGIIVVIDSSEPH
jgi:hypothetical protein